ncbi:hypothetical protein TWF132_007514 [Orbilia oligospora]|nr:hypothetical protein TWF132_007514 [Orbilia oligospora]
MTTTPFPSPVHFIQNVHYLPVGCKVKVLGLIQSYDPETGIMSLHHRPSIDVPLPQVHVRNGQGSRKRPAAGISGNENLVNYGETAGTERREIFPRQSIGSSSHVSVRGGNSLPERRHINGSGVAQGTGPSKRMANGGNTTIPNPPTNGITRNILKTPVSPASPHGKGIPQRPSNPPITPTRNHIVHLVQPSPPPLSPIKPLLAASKTAISALDSIGLNTRRSLSRPKPSTIAIPTTPPPPPSPSPIATTTSAAFTVLPPQPPQPQMPTTPQNYTLQVSIDLTLRTISSEQLNPLPPIIEGTWVNVIGYKRKDGVLDAISIFKVKGILNLEAYERAIVGMGRVRDTVEWEVKEGIARGRGLQGGVWD